MIARFKNEFIKRESQSALLTLLKPKANQICDGLCNKERPAILV